jgi:hypothetical protein
MMRCLFILFQIPCCILFFESSRSQSLQPDSTAYFDRIHAAIRSYEQFTGTQSRLYNGIEYLAYQYPATGIPFFGTAEWSLGSISYDGETFNQVSMLYDLLRDQLVILYFDSASRIVLRPELISWFKIQGHNFIRINGDSTRGVRDGFYDQLYAGPHEVLARRSKSVQESISGIVLTRTFEPSVHHYILFGNSFQPVNTKRSVLSLFQDKKKELRAYLRKNHIHFHRDPDLAITMMAQYYDQSRP